MKNNKGQTLVTVLGILLIFMIMIPTMVYMVNQESRWSVKQRKTTAAFQAAETGLDRAMWKIKETSATWDTIKNGGTIPGYAGTTVYNVYASTDNAVLLGQYKVTISSDITQPGRVKVLSVGRDAATSEVRAIEVILTTQNIDSSLSVDGFIDWKSNMTVHWGPVVTFNSITTTPPEYFPRKISKGKIQGRCNTPANPHTDGKEFWAFEDLGNPPQVDLAYYRDLAKASQVPTGSNFSGPAANPAGSGYFTGDIRFQGGYSFTSSTAVIYTTGDIRFDNGSFIDCKAIIAEGDITYKAKGPTPYVANVPPLASKEYESTHLSQPYNYPGRGSATYAVADCGTHGFLYCGGNLDTAGGNAVVCGVVKIIGNVSFNTFTIYYDPAVASAIKLKNAAIRRFSWREVKTAW